MTLHQNATNIFMLQSPQQTHPEVIKFKVLKKIHNLMQIVVEERDN